MIMYDLRTFLVSVDTANNAKVSFSSSGDLPVIVGGTVGTCVIIIIGVVFALFFYTVCLLVLSQIRFSKSICSLCFFTYILA